MQSKEDDLKRKIDAMLEGHEPPAPTPLVEIKGDGNYTVVRGDLVIGVPPPNYRKKDPQ